MLSFHLMLAENYLTNSVENTPSTWLSPVSHHQYQTFGPEKDNVICKSFCSPHCSVYLSQSAACLPSPPSPLFEHRPGAQL